MHLFVNTIYHVLIDSATAAHLVLLLGVVHACCCRRNGRGSGHLLLLLLQKSSLTHQMKVTGTSERVEPKGKQTASMMNPLDWITLHAIKHTSTLNDLLTKLTKIPQCRCQCKQYRHIYQRYYLHLGGREAGCSGRAASHGRGHRLDLLHLHVPERKYPESRPGEME